MAHFLSQSTHTRLLQRVEEEQRNRPHVYIPGLDFTTEFTSTIRCVAVLERTAEDEAKGSAALVRCWTGNLDGTISVREGLDGKPIHVLPQEEPNVFVFSLQQYREFMWAGLSNGYIYIYDIQTMKLIQEIKAHCGAVNCLLRSGDFIFSASSDWLVCQWNAVERRKEPGCTFTGHQNAVRCLAIDGQLLYSGGDDCVIRCWDLSTNTERTGTWPIIAHHDSVRAIVVHENYLFSASTDGTINVWNVMSAELVKQLEARNASITTLCLDTASCYLWAGSSDGLINIWDVSALTLVGCVDDHAETNVASIELMARLNAVKAWTVCDDGEVRVWYLDADPETNEYQRVCRMELELQQHVEDHRTRIVENFEALERCRAELVKMEETEKNTKECLAHVLGDRSRRALMQKYAAQASLYVDKNRQRDWAADTLTATVLRQSEVQLLQRYWGRWGAATRQRQDFRRKKAVAAFMAEYDDQCVVRVCLKNLAAMASADRKRIFKIKLATALSRRLDAGILRIYYSKWVNFRRARIMESKADMLSEHMARTQQLNLIGVYWQKLQAVHYAKHCHALIREAMGSLLSNNTTATLRAAFLKWQSYLSQRKRTLRLRRAIEHMTGYNDFVLMRQAYNKLAGARQERLAAIAAARHAAQADEMARLRAFIEENQGYDETELDRLLMEKQMELATIIVGGSDLDSDIRKCEKRNMQLRREYMKDVQINIDKSPLEQIEQAFYFLKARGVSCYNHQAFIDATREEIKKIGAEKVYIAGLNEVKAILAKLVKPAPLMDDDSHDWFIGRSFNKITNKQTETANLGIVKMCVAYDTMNKGQLKAWVVRKGGKDEWGPNHQHNGEFVANFATLLDISIRSFHIRRKEDPVTGEPLAPEERSKSKSKSKSKKRKSKSKSKGKSKTPKRALSAPGGKKKSVSKAKSEESAAGSEGAVAKKGKRTKKTKKVKKGTKTTKKEKPASPKRGKKAPPAKKKGVKTVKKVKKGKKPKAKLAGPIRVIRYINGEPQEEELLYGEDQQPVVVEDEQQQQQQQVFSSEIPHEEAAPLETTEVVTAPPPPPPMEGQQEEQVGENTGATNVTPAPNADVPVPAHEEQQPPADPAQPEQPSTEERQ